MSEETNVAVSLDVTDQQAVLNYSQNLRVQIIGDNSHDPKLQLLAAQHLSKTATDLVRIKVDNDGNEASMELAKAVLSQVREVAVTREEIKDVSDVSAPEISIEDIGVFETVPGETATEQDTECNFASIVKEHVDPDMLDMDESIVDPLA